MRPSSVTPYLPFIEATLRDFPTLRSSRLWEMVRALGYLGSKVHFRSIVARHRPRRPAEAFHRLTVLPGEQAQINWAHFGTICCDGYERPLVAFVVVLTHLRCTFLRFFRSLAMGSFLRGHIVASHVGALRHRLDWGADSSPPIRLHLAGAAADVVVRPYSVASYDLISENGEAR